MACGRVGVVSRTRWVPLQAPRATQVLLPGVATAFRSLGDIDDVRLLVMEIKDRARELTSDDLDACRRLADALTTAWHSTPERNVRRDAAVLMCTRWGYAARQIEAERYRPRVRCVAESIKDALGYLHAQLVSAHQDSERDGVEPALWDRRSGYALRSGYYYGRVGPDTLLLLVANGLEIGTRADPPNLRT
jgi:hypothetical protein